jgi:hypothetical protein
MNAAEDEACEKRRRLNADRSIEQHRCPSARASEIALYAHALIARRFLHPCQMSAA